MFEVMTYFFPLVWEMMDSRFFFLSFLLNYRFRCRRYNYALNCAELDKRRAKFHKILFDPLNRVEKGGKQILEEK